MKKPTSCPQCGEMLSGEEIEGLCPRCLLESACRQSLEASIVGRTISRYRVLEKLGEGGMGEVFLAQDTALERKVALKFLAESVQNDAALRRRFTQEAKAAAALDHPYICHIHETGEFEGLTFIAMEYVEGRTLQERLREGPLEVGEALPITLEIADALEAAHRKQIVHRDLKPSNIMLTEQGHVKVMDFGLARRVKAETGQTTALTRTGAVFGTLAYMSPEQLRGELADARSDIFSFGLVLCEMLTGRHPFQGSASLETACAILSEKPELPRRGERSSRELRRILEGMLAKNRVHRFQSVQEVRAALQSVLDQMPALFPGSRRFFRQTPLRLALILMSAILLGVFAVYRAEGWLDGFMETVPSQPRQSIAVLPLDNLSGDSEQEYFADGVTSALISGLARIDQLRVVPRTSAMQYKDYRGPLSEIAAVLAVDLIVEGAVQRSGEIIEVQVNLIDPSTEDVLWSGSHRANQRALLSLQGQVARTIAEQVKIRLTAEEQRRLFTARSLDPQVHEAYFFGLHWLNQRSVEALQKATRYFQEAVDRDPDFAPAYAELANSYALLGDTLYGADPPRQAMANARHAALRAVELDPFSPEAHTSLGHIRFTYDWDWEGADEAFEMALQLNPDYPTARLWFGLSLAARERWDEAFAQIEEARRSDPLSPLVYATSGRLHYYRQAYGPAIQQYDKAIELDGDFDPAHIGLGMVYLKTREFDQAASQFREGFARRPGMEGVISLLRADDLTAPRSGMRKSLHALLEEGRVGVPPFYFAVAAAALGENDQAVHWLNQAYDQGSGYMPYIDVDPIFSDLHRDPRFEALLRRLRLRP